MRLAKPHTMSAFNRENLAMFWDFVAERQNIYHKKEVLKKPGPWTKDPVLRDFFFTNVYRRVDPGTKFIVDNNLELIGPKPDKLFNVMLYRYCGSQDVVFEEVGFDLLKYWKMGKAAKEFDRDMRRVKDMGIPPFGYAYTVSPYGHKGDKIELTAKMFETLANMFDTFFALVMSSQTAESAFEAINKALGFGPFLSWQVLVDITYPLNVYKGQPLLDVNINEWAMAGPGAHRGIQHVLRPAARVSDLWVMSFLYRKQHNYLPQRDFKYLQRDGINMPVGLADIQNCFCEFSKYYKIKNGLEVGQLPKGRIRKYDQKKDI